MNSAWRTTLGFAYSAVTCPKSPFSGPRFVLALAGIRRLVVRIKATEKEDLILRELGLAHHLGLRVLGRHLIESR